MPASFGGWSGRSHGWRYLAQRIDGTGTPGAWLANELPIQDVTITDVLSGPPQLTGTIPRSYAEMIGPDGQPLLGEWATAIYAECDAQIRAGTIYVGGGFKPGDWDLDCTGFVTLMVDMGYPSVAEWRQTDPLEIVRHMWSITQADNGSNLGMIVDNVTHTPVRVGAAEGLVTDTTTGSGTTTGDPGSTDNKAYELNWWSSTDLGGEIDKLAKSTPFAYHERHQWNSTQTAVNHYLDFGYPTIGRRRDNLRFVVGENISKELEPDRDGGGFANDVVILGAGEGSAMIRGQARIMDGRIHRQVTLSDTSIEDASRAQQAARVELGYRQQLTQVKTVILRNHPMALVGSFGVGDEIRVQGMTDWMDVDVWARVISVVVTPDNPDIMTLTIQRSDWMN